MRVAFATTDLVTVDAHFGTTPRLLFYEVDGAAARPAGEVAFLAVGEDGDHGKLGPRLDALAGCTLLYAAAIGPTAAAQVGARKVRAAQAKPGERIDELLPRLVRLLAGTPPPWLQKALRQGAPPDTSPAVEAAPAARSDP